VCPHAVTSKLSSLLRNRRQPGRPASGLYSLQGISTNTYYTNAMRVYTHTLLTLGPSRAFSLDGTLKISPQLPSCTSARPAPIAPKHYKYSSNICFRVSSAKIGWSLSRLPTLMGFAAS
jgi:hypothetical protein